MLRFVCVVILGWAATATACSSAGNDLCSIAELNRTVCASATSVKDCGKRGDDSTRWREVPCDDGHNPSCATNSNGRAFCSKSSVRSPECAGRANSSYCTTASEVHLCNDGFLVVGDCNTAGSPTRTCAVGGDLDQQICATSSTPEPRCDGNVQSFCYKGKQIDCSGGYAIGVRDCQSCVAKDSTTADCR
jgi:hypothetical protein